MVVPSNSLIRSYELQCIVVSTGKFQNRNRIPADSRNFWLKCSILFTLRKLIIVVYADPLLLRDEVGFVCVLLQGQEQWTYMVEGPIRDCHINGNVIVGETLDGEAFVCLLAQ